MLFAVFTEDNIHGIYKNKSAAQQLKKELTEEGKEPVIEKCDRKSTFPHRKGQQGRMKAIEMLKFNNLGKAEDDDETRI